MKCPFLTRTTASYQTEYDDNGDVAVNNLIEEVTEFQECIGLECAAYCVNGVGSLTSRSCLMLKE